MKPIPDIVPYFHSSDVAVNASITFAKLRAYIRRVNPSYKPLSLYQARLKNKQAARRLKRGLVR